LTDEEIQEKKDEIEFDLKVDEKKE